MYNSDFPKLFAFSLLLALLSLSLSAQDWQWAIRGGSVNLMQMGDDANVVVDLAFDPAGNMYLVAPVGAGGLEVDGHPLNAFSTIGISASTDVLLSSFTADGQYRWSKVFGVSSGDVGYDVEVDHNGGVYLAVTTTSGDPKHLDSDTTLNSTANLLKKMYLAKYDSAGAFQWVRLPEEDSLSNYASGSVSQWHEVEPNGTVHWLCYLMPGSLPRSPYRIDTAGFYVIRYNAQGQLLGRTRLDLEAVDPYGPKLFAGTDGTGNFQYDPQRQRYYIGGWHWRLFDRDTLLVGGDTLKGNPYILTYDAQDGSLVWKKDGGNTDGGITDLQLDHQGNIYVTGVSSNSDTIFGNILYQAPPFPGNWPTRAPYFLKFNPAGKLLWSQFGSGKSFDASSITINGSEVAFCGSSNGIFFSGGADTLPDFNVYSLHADAYIARFDRQSGQPLGLHAVEGPDNDISIGFSLGAGPNGDYYMGGNFRSWLFLGADTLFQVGSQRSFFLTHLGCDSLQPSFSWQEDSLGLLFQYTGHETDSLHWDFGEGGPLARGDSLWHAYGSTGRFPVCVTAYNSYCGDTTYCDTVQVTQIGLPEAAALASLKIYPNPTEDRLVLQSPQGAGTYRLSSLAGKRLREGTYRRGRTALSLKSLPPGLYLLHLESAKGARRTVKLRKR